MGDGPRDYKSSLRENVAAVYAAHRVDTNSPDKFLDSLARIATRLEADAVLALGEHELDPDDETKEKIALEASEEFLTLAELLHVYDDLMRRVVDRMAELPDGEKLAPDELAKIPLDVKKLVN